MMSVIHLAPERPQADLRSDGAAVLEVLGRRPGFLRGCLARATDDPRDWVLVTEWTGVGDYRRALGNGEVRTAAASLLALALDRPSGYEQLVTADAGLVTIASDLAMSPGVG